jgi:hypothetical protein
MWTTTGAALITVFALSSCSPVLESGLDEQCEGFLYQAIAHPSDENKFIGCLHEEATVFSCKSEHEVFDSDSTTCVSKIAKKYDDDENPCEDVIFGNVPIPGNCTFFFYCEFERAFLRYCGEGSIFDRSTMSCAEGDEEECLQGLPTESTVEPETSTILVPTEETTTVAEEPTKETEEPTTESTTKRTSELTTQTSEITSRPETSTTEEEFTTHNSTGSSSYPATTQIPSTTTRNEVIITFNCPLSGYGNIPNSIYCNRYYECLAGIRYLQSCPGDLLFDAITMRCTSPELALCANFIQCG